MRAAGLVPAVWPRRPPGRARRLTVVLVFLFRFLPARLRGEELAAKPRESFAAQVDLLAGHLDLEQVVQRLVVEETDHRSGGQAQGLPAAQPFGAVILHL